MTVLTFRVNSETINHFEEFRVGIAGVILHLRKCLNAKSFPHSTALRLHYVVPALANKAEEFDSLFRSFGRIVTDETERKEGKVVEASVKDSLMMLEHFF